MAGVRDDGILLVNNGGSGPGTAVDITGPLGSTTPDANSVAVVISADQLPLPVDATVTIPPGISTEAKQDDQIVQLAAIETAVESINTKLTNPLPVSVSGTVPTQPTVEDLDAFTEGSSRIQAISGVRNDTGGLSDVPNGTQAAPRITRQRALHSNLRADDGEEIVNTPLNITPSNSARALVTAAFMFQRNQDSSVQPWTGRPGSPASSDVLPGVKSIRAVGLASANLIALNDQLAIDINDGNYEAVTIRIRPSSLLGTVSILGLVDGAGGFGLTVFNTTTGRWQSGTLVNPTDDGIVYYVPAAGLDQIIIRITAFTSGTVEARYNAGPGTNAIVTLSQVDSGLRVAESLTGAVVFAQAFDDGTGDAVIPMATNGVPTPSSIGVVVKPATALPDLLVSDEIDALNDFVQISDNNGYGLTAIDIYGTFIGKLKFTLGGFGGGEAQTSVFNPTTNEWVTEVEFVGAPVNIRLLAANTPSGVFNVVCSQYTSGLLTVDISQSTQPGIIKTPVDAQISALVSDLPPNYESNAYRPLSITSDGRLRVATVAARIPSAEDITPDFNFIGSPYPVGGVNQLSPW